MIKAVQITEYVMRPLVAFILAPIPGAIFFVGVYALSGFIAGSEPEPLITLIFGLIGGLMFCYSIIGFIAFPIFLFLRSKNIESALVTIIIAALLASLIAVPTVFNALSTTEWGTKHVPYGHCAGYTGGYFTICIYTRALALIALTAVCGAIAGATFWLVYRSWERYKRRWIIAAVAVIAALALLVMVTWPRTFSPY